jgi:hypothetical protein
MECPDGNGKREGHLRIAAAELAAGLLRWAEATKILDEVTNASA